jgi:hypothetical protein
MNVANDRITKYISSTIHKPHYIWECIPCRFQGNCQASFLDHKASKKCSMYHGDWFIKMKKRGMKNYYHIVHKYKWSQIMMNIRNDL